jgi:glutamine amidotransferase
MSVVIIDYGLGNIASVLNMVRKEGGVAKISREPGDVLSASKLILPGVGAFDHGIDLLKKHNLFEPIQQRAASGAPLLGICLGMQLLGCRSEEGQHTGLGLVEANFTRFSFEAHGTTGLRVPHVGWNQVNVTKPNPLISGDGSEQRFYFTHSYHAVCVDETDVMATTEYGYPFAAAFSRDNVYGVQFHPEKSHRFGMALLRNFLSL